MLKLHGTLTGGLIDYEKIVFTRNQYNKHYGEGSSLPDELKTCFENRMMFFLGCSLENDRTMELLQEINKDGCYYYTIIGCKKSEKGNKVIDLGNNHIRAILYEDKRHEAVRVILEHLLEETNPDTYNTLSFHIGALKSIDPSERFSYKAEIMPFTGRKQEMEELNTFLGDPNVAFHWWAITGPGGCGKSRLAYEFQKHLPSGWAAHYLGADDYENLSLLTEKLTQKTLLIADYVQENAKAIGKWMEQLNERKRSLPIRVLLLERDVDEERDNAVWTKQLYEDIHHKQKLKSACYKGNFLTLQTLSDEDLLTIIENYALALRPSSKPASGALHDVTKQLLLQKLKSVDPELCRPLYAMFITDAYIEGKNPEQWDRNDILDYVTTREQDRLKFNMEQVIGKSDEKLYDACLYLQSMATVLQDASLEELQTLCPEVWAIVKEKANSFTSPSNMLEKIGLAAQGKVSALRPDLIGEYFIYTWLLEHQDKSQPFLRAAWKKPAPTAVSFARIFNDYDYLLNENAKNWELVLLKDIPVSENTALFYAMLLSDTINYCNIPEECEWQANLLQEIASKYPKSPEIAALFATGLVNLSAKQDEAGVGDTVKIGRASCRERV